MLPCLLYKQTNTLKLTNKTLSSFLIQPFKKIAKSQNRKIAKKDAGVDDALEHSNQFAWESTPKMAH